MTDLYFSHVVFALFLSFLYLTDGPSISYNDGTDNSVRTKLAEENGVTWLLFDQSKQSAA